MTKQWKCYAKKPEQIRNAKDLLKFFNLIPAKMWCVDMLERPDGRRCAMGHLNAAYCGSPFKWNEWKEGKVDGFATSELASANNGDYTDPSRAKTGGKIKSRVVNFIKANIDR